MAAVQQQGPIQLVLTPSLAGFRPGDTVTALLQASTFQPDAVELQEVEVDVTGVERVDTSWVSPAYRRDEPAINSDRRKVQRLLLQSRLQAATQGAFSDSSLRRFVIRFTLPTWLPPTFRGTAVRYSYTLQARVTYRELQPGELAADAPGALPEGYLMPEDLPRTLDDEDDEDSHPAPSTAQQQANGSRTQQRAQQPVAGAGGAATTASVTVRIPLHLWPLRPELAAQAERSSAAGATSSGGAANGLGRSSSSRGATGEDVGIKCREIGPGTAVQDAISHISKLAAVPAALRPTSPGTRRASRLQQQQEWAAERANGVPKVGSDTSHARAEDTPSKQEAAQQVQQQRAAADLPPRDLAVLRRPSLSRAVAADADRTSLLSPSQSLALDSSLAAMRSYALRIGEHPLVRVSLHPPPEGSLQPGATLGATLEFARPAAAAARAAAMAAAATAAGAQPDSAVEEDDDAPMTAGLLPRCMQVLVLLETEEAVEAPWRPKGAGGIRRVWDEHSEVTADAACSHVLFTVPADATPSFQTPLVQLRWLLRFQFTASTPKTVQGSSAVVDGGNPLLGSIEQLAWTLPLTMTSPRM